MSSGEHFGKHLSELIAQEFPRNFPQELGKFFRENVEGLPGVVTSWVNLPITPRPSILDLKSDVISSLAPVERKSLIVPDPVLAGYRKSLHLIELDQFSPEDREAFLDSSRRLLVIAEAFSVLQKVQGIALANQLLNEIDAQSSFRPDFLVVRGVTQATLSMLVKEFGRKRDFPDYDYCLVSGGADLIRSDVELGSRTPAGWIGSDLLGQVGMSRYKDQMEKRSLPLGKGASKFRLRTNPVIRALEDRVLSALPPIES